MRINRIGNWAKTTILAGLLVTAPLSAKSQIIKNGEKILARDTVELMNGKKAQALLIDTDGNQNNFERFALNRVIRSNSSGHKSLNGEKGFDQIENTQYVDTLVRVFKKTEGQPVEELEYYVAGPSLRKNIVIERKSGKIVANSASKTNMDAVSYNNHTRTLVSLKKINN